MTAFHQRWWARMIMTLGWAGFLCLLVFVPRFLGSCRTEDEGNLRENLRVRALNSYMPSQYRGLAEALASGQAVDGIYEIYFKIASEFLPVSFAGHYLMGICHQSQGRSQEALESYRRSLHLNSGFFWAYYNMGIIYWRAGQFDAARAAWSTALKLPAQGSLQALFSDKLLRDIVAGLQKDGYDPGRQIQKGYNDLFRWISSGAGPDDMRPVLF